MKVGVKNGKILVLYIFKYTHYTEEEITEYEYDYEYIEKEKVNMKEYEIKTLRVDEDYKEEMIKILDIDFIIEEIGREKVKELIDEVIEI